MPPLASIQRQHIAGSGRPARFRIDRTRSRDLLLKFISVLLAHGLAMLTLVISVQVWIAWRSPDQSIEPWSLLALACLLCLHPFAALGVSAVLASPSDAIGIARSLVPCFGRRWLKNAIRVSALALVSAALLASTALLLFRALV